VGPVYDDLRNFKPTHWEGPNGMGGKFTDPGPAYATSVEWHQKDVERLSGMINDDPGPVDLGRVLGMTEGQVNRLGLPENVTVTFTRTPPPGVTDIAKAYDGCDDPACTLCKNPTPAPEIPTKRRWY